MDFLVDNAIKNNKKQFKTKQKTIKQQQNKLRNNKNNDKNKTKTLKIFKNYYYY